MRVCRKVFLRIGPAPALRHPGLDPGSSYHFLVHAKVQRREDGEMDRSRLTTAIAIADAFGLDPKSYRAALRRRGLYWHEHNERWLVSAGSPEQADMLGVARQMMENKNA